MHLSNDYLVTNPRCSQLLFEPVMPAMRDKDMLHYRESILLILVESP